MYNLILGLFVKQKLLDTHKAKFYFLFFFHIYGKVCITQLKNTNLLNYEYVFRKGP